VLPELLRTVLLPWAVATVAVCTTGASWPEAVFVSASLLGAGLLGGWTTMRARNQQRTKGHAALERVQQREAQALHASGVLNAELTHLRQEVTDPRTDARRDRLRALGLAVELGIGDRRIPVRLRDLTLTDLWLELPRSEAAQWMNGLPARVTLVHEGRHNILGWAVADRPLRLPKEATPTWRLRWREPLREHELPKAVWRATMDREAHRVRPHPDSRAWVHTPNGTRVAILNDLSASGVGLTVPMGLRDVGRLPRRLRISLHLPEHEAPLELVCTLVHLDVRAAGAALGLSLDPQDHSFAELQPRLAAHVMRQDAKHRIRLVS